MQEGTCARVRRSFRPGRFQNPVETSEGRPTAAHLYSARRFSACTDELQMIWRNAFSLFRHLFISEVKGGRKHAFQPPRPAPPGIGPQLRLASASLVASVSQLRSRTGTRLLVAAQLQASLPPSGGATRLFQNASPRPGLPAGPSQRGR